MKKVMNIIALCALVFLVTSLAPGQKRSTKGAASKQGTAVPRIVCQGQSVPKGFVIAGYRSSAQCGENSELVIKKPTEVEVVCNSSPIPDGYQLISQQFSPTCNTRDSNILNNALKIAQDGSGASSQTTVNRVNRVESVRQPRVVVQVGRGAEVEDERKPKSVVEHRAAEEQKKTEMELAILHHQIKVGMTIDQVLASWGLPSNTENVTRSGSGTSSTWYYRKNNERVRLEFDNGILSDYHWYH